MTIKKIFLSGCLAPKTAVSCLIVIGIIAIRTAPLPDVIQEARAALGNIMGEGTTNKAAVFIPSAGGAGTSNTIGDSNIYDTTTGGVPGNVGIGTPFPTQRLDVNGQIHASTDVCIGSGASAKCLSTLSAGGGGGGAQWWTQPGGTTHIHNINPGNVGVGTAAPSQKLDVAGSFHATGNISVGGGIASGGALPWPGGAITSAGPQAALGAGDRTKAGESTVLYRDAGITRIWDSTAGDRMVINTAGNIGVGTAVPSQKLDVAGSIRSSTLAGIGMRCVHTDASGVLSATSGDCGAGGGGGGITTINGPGGSATGPTIFFNGAGVSQSGNTFTFSGGGGGGGGITSINGMTGPAISIGAGGGISVSSSGNTVTITNTGGGGGGDGFWGQVSGSNSIYNTNTGNVGIGTTAPGKKLHVMQSGGATILVENTTSGTGGAEVEMKEGGGGDWLFKAIQNNGGFKIRDIAAAQDRLTINNTGNVGIGTGFPGFRLDVAGAVNATQYCIGGSSCITSWPAGGGGTGPWQVNGTSVYYNGGKVGIGTANPSQMLEIVSDTPQAEGWVGLRVQNTSGNYRYWSGVVPGGSGVSAGFVVNYGAYGGGVHFNSSNGEGHFFAGGDARITAGWPTSARNIVFSTSQQDRVRIASDGSVHILGPTSNIYMNPNTGLGTSDRAWGVAPLATGPNRLVLQAGGGERLSILGNGNVGIGNQNPGFRLDVAGTVNASGYASGGVCVYGSCASDIRLKTDIQPIQGALEKITTLKPVSFEFIDPRYGSGRQQGLIAQDVEKVYPELVSTDAEGYKHVQYGLGLTMQMLGAIQEQQAEIDALKENNADLQRQIDILKQSVGSR